MARSMQRSDQGVRALSTARGRAEFPNRLRVASMLYCCFMQDKIIA
jgi:hypothetical protein